MNYISTRNSSNSFKFKDVFIKGLADDGGLFIPKSLHKYSQKDLRDFELGRSMEELEQFIDQILSPGVEESREIVDTSVAPTGGAILERQAVLPVSPALTTPVNNTIVNNQMAAANTLGARYLGGINYNRMNTAQKADYADKVFKTTV